MKRLGKWLGLSAVALLVLLAIGITFTIGWRPFFGPRARPLTDKKFEATPQRLERGRYIATALSGCIYCHSPHDWTAEGHPQIEGKEGAGEVLPYGGLPGKLSAPNLTPDPETGAGNWSDDQLARAIREGVGHDGRALFPLMPYQHYRSMSDKDVASVIVYLRSLPPVKNAVPKTEIIFPVKYLIRSVPEPLTEPVPDLATTDAVKRGGQLVNLAGCMDCHTVERRGKFDAALTGGGGEPFTGPWGFVASANITPDASGIAAYDPGAFLVVMRSGMAKDRQLSPVMPVSVYRNLTNEDLRAMFEYLKTIPPVKHVVNNTEPPTPCKVCQQKHGGGEKN
jgi:mono/diheme cytochrome c family protein